MALWWIIFGAMEKLGSYIILVRIFYQILIQTFSSSGNIYLTIDNTIITTHLIIMLLPYIFHILSWYFESVNPYWLLNSKRQPWQKHLKRYIKQFYQRKNKNQEVLPNKQSTAWKYRWSDSSNDDTTSRNQSIPLINFRLISFSKESLEKNKVWHRIFQDLCRFWCLVLCNTW